MAAISLLLYKDLGWRDIPQLLLNAFSTSATVMLVIGATGAMAWLITVEQVAAHRAALGHSASDGAVTRVDAATAYYPIVKRAPRGLWSGDQVRVIDGFIIPTPPTTSATQSMRW